MPTTAGVERSAWQALIGRAYGAVYAVLTVVKNSAA